MHRSQRSPRAVHAFLRGAVGALALVGLTLGGAYAAEATPLPFGATENAPAPVATIGSGAATPAATHRGGVSALSGASRASAAPAAAELPRLGRVVGAGILIAVGTTYVLAGGVIFLRRCHAKRRN
ncbi:hypothetical protein EDF60_0361 [Leucobacter luti]|nr:hypothetical protein [Leucobacter luti]TCK45136.1 hypothetical protein EDF60_0361 [Leucobacter luti]